MQDYSKFVHVEYANVWNLNHEKHRCVPENLGKAGSIYTLTIILINSVFFTLEHSNNAQQVSNFKLLIKVMNVAIRPL